MELETGQEGKKKPGSETNTIHSFLYAEPTFRTSACAHVCDMKGEKGRRAIGGGEASRSREDTGRQ